MPEQIWICATHACLTSCIIKSNILILIQKYFWNKYRQQHIATLSNTLKSTQCFEMRASIRLLACKLHYVYCAMNTLLISKCNSELVVSCNLCDVSCALNTLLISKCNSELVVWCKFARCICALSTLLISKCIARWLQDASCALCQTI